jgi:hypothetical protein
VLSLGKSAIMKEWNIAVYDIFERQFSSAITAEHAVLNVECVK